MANVKITELTALTNPASTDVLPIVDVAADATKKVTIADLLENASSGSASAPAFAFDADSDTGIYRPGADQLAISTGGTGRLFINSSGNVGIGTTSVSNLLHLRSDSASNVDHLYLQNRNGGANSGARIAFSNGTADYADNRYAYIGAINTGASESGNHLVFATNANGGSPSEKARIDSSGRLLVGTSSARGGFFGDGLVVPSIQLETSGSRSRQAWITNANDGQAPEIIIAKSRGTANGSVTVVQNGDELGMFSFQGTDGTDFTEAARIQAFVDGTPGANDMPGRLVFSTTASGSSTPTQRMKIDSSGHVFINTNAGLISADEILTVYQGISTFGRDFGPSVIVNRSGNDGDLVLFYQSGVLEGSISVSGTTVSYNGAHLSRWSQLVGIDPYSKTARPEILRGTVMSNLDEMCDWTCPTSGDCQNNEQLNKTEISSVDDDPNVAGVFQAWDDDDDTWVNDFHLAMTGDFVIRIAAGTTVQRGDLLCSAGDGTAKPQSDDIVRSKTIAKVTSTAVSCTYSDGSYCVPCVLMAC